MPATKLKSAPEKTILLFIIGRILKKHHHISLSGVKKVEPDPGSR
jgi:hypothetical protein